MMSTYELEDSTFSESYLHCASKAVRVQSIASLSKRALAYDIYFPNNTFSSLLLLHR